MNTFVLSKLLLDNALTSVEFVGIALALPKNCLLLVVIDVVLLRVLLCVFVASILNVIVLGVVVATVPISKISLPSFAKAVPKTCASV